MNDLEVTLTHMLQSALAAGLGASYASADPLLRAAANPQFGDYQSNVAMSLAKALGDKPRSIAEKIVAHLAWQGICQEKPTIAGPGFINMKLSAAWLADRAAAMAGDERLGVPVADPALQVVVDYSGPNVAKEMHVGHLRSTVIGDSLARVLAFAGHHVRRQNHLGDWGTQFGMLIEYLLDQQLSAATLQIHDLNELYRQSKKRFDDDAGFATRARQRVVALQGGDAATLALWQGLIDESKRHFNQAYQRLGVLLTDADVCPESFYNPRLAPTVAALEQAGLARESQGALCVFPQGFTGPEGQPAPLIIRKSDGGFLYATTDLAALRYRLLDPSGPRADRVIYVTDARQKQHFAMVFTTAQEAGWVTTEGGRPAPRLEHVPFGTVLGEDGKPFKTRSGDTVKLADLLDEAVERAGAIVTQKNPDLPAADRHEIARAVGIGAVKYADLCNDRVKDYVFSWERMLAFDGNTAPYLQNAYVRIRSIFRKAAATGVGQGWPTAAITLADPAERTLALKLLQFPSAVAGVAESLEPHRLCTYLYELAATYHQFYEKCPVLTAPDDATRHSRLRLSDLCAKTLRQGLSLLGIAVVEQM